MRFAGPAPTARANACSATRMTAVLTVEANCHSLRPPGRMHKGKQVEPLETVLHQCDGPLTATRPHGAQEGLEPESMLVGGPDLNVSAGMRCAHLRYLLAESVGTTAA
jgi:hypothetical protein